MSDFSAEQTALNSRLPTLRRELGSIQETQDGINDWLALISDYMELETLDRATVTGLIERITVSERVKQDCQTTQELDIEYRFIGKLPQNAKEDVA